MRVLRPVLRTLRRNLFKPLVHDDQRSWRGLDLLIASMHLARAIERATDRPHVGFLLPTSGLSPVALIATWLLGRTCVPLNYLLKGEDLAYVLNDAEVDTVVTVRPMLEQFGALPEGVSPIHFEDLHFRGIPPFRRAARRSDDHLAVLLYTSGTSGKPKGVMLTSGNLASNVEQILEWIGFSRSDTLLGVLPQFHSFGLTVLTLLPLSAGCRVVYTARFVPRRILELIRKHEPTALIAIPSMYNALLGLKNAGPEDFRSLRWVVSGGEPLPQAVTEGFRTRFGLTINEGYGLTETSPVTNWCRPDEHRPRTVGRPLPRVQECIVAPDGRHLGPGEDGEIRIKGPNVMRGYYKLEEESRRAFDEQGYFRTGDMGRFDAEGFLYITGRIKEMLIIGGENVFPREIEEVLDRHPSVHASAVIGVVDASRGEIAVAFVELNEGAAFDENALRAHCREGLAQFKVPRDIRLIEKLPRNPTGKIMRRDLRSLVAGDGAQP